MKKLLIMAVVLAAGIATNAASFRWSASGVKDITGTSDYNGTAILYAYLSTADASTAVVVDNATMSGGAIAASGTVFSSDNLVTGSIYKFYYTMEDSIGNVFTSGTRQLKAQATSTGTLSFAATGSWLLSLSRRVVFCSLLLRQRITLILPHSSHACL